MYALLIKYKQIDDLPKLSKLLFSENIDDIKYSTQAIRKMISEDDDPPIDELFQAKVVTIFVNIIRQSEDQFLQTIWTLANIAGDNMEFRDTVLEDEGIIKRIIKLMQEKEDINIIEYSIWFLTSLCKDSPHPPFELISECIPIFGKYLNSNDQDVIQLCCLGLNETSDGDDKNVNAVLELNCIPRLIEILKDTSDYNTQLYIVKLFGNLTSGSDYKQTQSVLAHSEVLILLQKLLKKSKRTLKKEICFTISNITAGTQPQISQVIETGLIEDILEVMQNSNHSIRQECCWILSNAINGGDDEQVLNMINESLVEAFADFLEDTDSKIIRICLESFEKILQLGDHISEIQGSDENKVLTLIEKNEVITKIEKLHQYKKESIQNLSKKISNNFFNKN
ncbi:importin alpha [Anaeramoeba flamelloides]|uniref:Importin alpha n=1 Tax=Anaeramoeba flamelloides TaxID=1746091 RepID=A0AAV7ZBH5_9EUKA|nr:importin alpha [Anaeramoeba flamelloides]